MIRAPVLWVEIDSAHVLTTNPYQVGAAQAGVHGKLHSEALAGSDFPLDAEGSHVFDLPSRESIAFELRLPNALSRIRLDVAVLHRPLAER